MMRQPVEDFDANDHEIVCRDRSWIFAPVSTGRSTKMI